MKNITVLALLLAAVAAFFLGRCNAPKCPDPITTERVDTLYKEKLIYIDPIPEPITGQPVKVVFNPKTVGERDSLLEKLIAERAYFQNVISGKERTITELQAAMNEPDGGVGFEVAEEQTPNRYEIDEINEDSTIRMQGRISVLGTLYEAEPPMFLLSYTELFRQKYTTQPIHQKRKNRGIGIALAGRRDWTPDDLTQAGARLHYRTGALFVGGGVWSEATRLNLTGFELFTGFEIGWTKKE